MSERKLENPGGELPGSRGGEQDHELHDWLQAEREVGANSNES